MEPTVLVEVVPEVPQRPAPPAYSLRGVIYGGLVSLAAVQMARGFPPRFLPLGGCMLAAVVIVLAVLPRRWRQPLVVAAASVYVPFLVIAVEGTWIEPPRWRSALDLWLLIPVGPGSFLVLLTYYLFPLIPIGVVMALAFISAELALLTRWATSAPWWHVALIAGTWNTIAALVVFAVL